MVAFFVLNSFNCTFGSNSSHFMALIDLSMKSSLPLNEAWQASFNSSNWPSGKYTLNVGISLSVNSKIFALLPSSINGIIAKTCQTT